MVVVVVVVVVDVWLLLWTLWSCVIVVMVVVVVAIVIVVVDVWLSLWLCCGGGECWDGLCRWSALLRCGINEQNAKPRCQYSIPHRTDTPKHFVPHRSHNLVERW